MGSPEANLKEPVRVQKLLVESLRKRFRDFHWSEEKIARTFLLLDSNGDIEFKTARSAAYRATDEKLALVELKIKELGERAKNFGVICPNGTTRQIEEIVRTAINSQWEGAESNSWIYVVVK